MRAADVHHTPHGAICCWCGREWEARGRGDQLKATGFLISAANNHGFYCRDMTPEQRRKRDDRDAKRWAKHPPSHRITLRLDHPGLTGV